MADTIKSAAELKIVSKYVDGDTRTITLDDPKDNLTDAQINGVSATFKTNNFLLGDKGGADFLEFDTAKVTQKKTTQLDLR